MDTLKINISLPVEMYKQARILVDRGLYASFSEMVRNGIRNEVDMQREINPDFVKSISKAEKSGFVEFKNGRALLKDLHEAV
ncbi:MAG: ribbon-helix-helix domain-containing protein [Candidatus Altiarchaeota archaeon]